MSGFINNATIFVQLNNSGRKGSESVPDFLNLSLSWMIYPTIIVAIFSTVIMLLNGAIIYALFRSNALRKNICKILYALALNDFFYAVISFLIVHEVLYKAVKEIFIFFELRRIFKALLLLISTNTIALVSVNRYMEMICLPSRQLQTKTMNWIISACWIVPFLTVVFSIILSQKKMIQLLLGVQNLFAIIIIITCYHLILKRLRQNTQDMKKYGISRRMYLANERHASKTTLLIITCYILFQSPLALSLIIDIWWKNNTLYMQKWKFVGFLLSLINSMLNPIIYSYKTKSIKAVLMTKFRFCRKVTVNSDYNQKSAPDSSHSREFVNTTGSIFVIHQIPPE